MATFAENLKRMRIKRGMSQEALAEAMKVSRSAIAQWETGRASPDLDTMLNLAMVLGVSFDDLIGRVIVDQKGRPTIPREAIPVGPSVMLPVLGTIRAGQPILTAEEVIGYEPADIETIRAGEHFYLVVNGDSMINDHITPGSLVLVRRQEEVEPNDIAVINVNGEEATLKRMRVVGDRAILISSNPAYPNQEYPASDIRVIGKVVEAKIKF